MSSTGRKAFFRSGPTPTDLAQDEVLSQLLIRANSLESRADALELGKADLSYLETKRQELEDLIAQRKAELEQSIGDVSGSLAAYSEITDGAVSDLFNKAADISGVVASHRADTLVRLADLSGAVQVKFTQANAYTDSKDSAVRAAMADRVTKENVFLTAFKDAIFLESAPNTDVEFSYADLLTAGSQGGSSNNNQTDASGSGTQTGGGTTPSYTVTIVGVKATGASFYVSYTATAAYSDCAVFDSNNGGYGAPNKVISVTSTPLVLSFVGSGDINGKTVRIKSISTPSNISAAVTVSNGTYGDITAITAAGY